ncbi:hypothetical protein V3O24_11080, partial [Methylobacter sp. Wu8]|uniref:hypothetical protein n=1 Tax=Methylobacter sp. Wu8 TaxID=3118457 RepID=UPI002F2CA8E8
MVVSLGRGAGQGQYAGAAVVAAGDAVLGGESQRVAAGEAGRKCHRGPGNLGIVDIGEGDGVVDSRRRTVFGIAQRTACGQYR